MTAREKVEEIFRAGIAAVQPQHIIPLWVQRQHDILIVKDEKIELSNVDHIYLLGAGKASAAMANALEDILGDVLTSGLIVTKYGHSLPLKKTQIIEAAHPVPDENSLKATEDILAFASTLTKNDLVFFLLSGGASSLMADCPDGTNLETMQQLFSKLLHSGASILEMNTVRKQLSKIKGGGLAKAVYPARLFSLMISDVPGDDMSIIGSGPTEQDVSPKEKAKDILEKYNIYKGLDEVIKYHIDADKIPVDKAVFENTTNYIIANNQMALNAAAQKAAIFGYKAIISPRTIEGLAGEVARNIMDEANRLIFEGLSCLIYGGETTVEVKNKSGIGGRSQELALAALSEIREERQITLLAGGTDGGDGPTSVAGAIVDNETKAVSEQKKISPEKYLSENNSFVYFQAVGGHVYTGPTNTNVMDMVIVLVDNPQ
ncbi:DUF4147 domain-containing protein [Parapusillimonas sp. SGNA-6]|nr:DUF4147 domain-containing protein [Parapusillimonas sp. SGNA-6]